MQKTLDELKMAILEIKQFCNNQNSCKTCPLRISDNPTCFVDNGSWESVEPRDWFADWSCE